MRFRIGQRIRGKENLTEQCAAETGTRCQGRTFHLHRNTAFGLSCGNPVGGFAVKRVGCPNAALPYAESVAQERLAYGPDCRRIRVGRGKGSRRMRDRRARIGGRNLPGRMAAFRADTSRAG